MRVDWAVACRFAEVNGGVATLVGAGIDTFWLPQFPGPIQLFLVLRIAGAEAELQPDVEHELQIQLLGPDMVQLDELQAQFAGAGAGPAHEPGWELTSVIPVLLQVMPQEPGTHSFEISIDGQHKRGVPISVRQGPPPGVAPPE